MHDVKGIIVSGLGNFPFHVQITSELIEDINI